MAQRVARAGLVVAAVGGLLVGCAGFQPQAGPPPEPASTARYQTLTTPIVAVGDTQEHESTGYPLHDNDSAVDAFIEVAQRPPEQPLFGRRVLEWALEQHAAEPFIHLGDVMTCRAAPRPSAWRASSPTPGGPARCCRAITTG